MNKNKSRQLIAFYNQLNKLKKVVRRGWELRDIPAPESVADHTFGVALLTLIFARQLELDMEKALMIALLHEVGETVVGDITPFDGVSRAEKGRQEEAAATAILGEIDETGELLALWQDYHHRASPESRLVKELDGLEMILQAYLYEQETGKVLDDFFQNVAGQLHTPLLEAIFQAVQAERAERA